MTSATRVGRQARIVSILSSESVHSQTELAAMLADEPPPEEAPPECEHAATVAATAHKLKVARGFEKLRMDFMEDRARC